LAAFIALLNPLGDLITGWIRTKKVERYMRAVLMLGLSYFTTWSGAMGHSLAVGHPFLVSLGEGMQAATGALVIVFNSIPETRGMTMTFFSECLKYVDPSHYETDTPK
jgi:hypothetical protein